MKMRHFRKMGIVFAAFSLLILAYGVPTFAVMDALDGKTFSGEVGKKGEASGMKDDLVFKDGKFRSTACDAYGFGDANYSAAPSGEATAFQAETHNPKDESMKWSGTITGNALEGTAVMTTPGQEPVEYWVKATLKQS